MISALHELKRAGYKLALDDFRYRDGSAELLDLFDVVKLSMPELGRQGMRDLAERLRPYEGKVLGDKLGTQPEHEICIALGFHLFQGYFFCRPSVVGTRGIAANRLALLQVVAALNDPAAELTDVEQLIARDVALSFRLLRYVNSAYFGLRGDVRSIGQALALLGLENVKRWATLSTLASIDNKPTELTLTALIRARFCELAGGQLGIATPAELFTLGLFSVIDGMMDAPMHDVVASLPLAEDMREALVRRSREDGSAARLRDRTRDRRGRSRDRGRQARRRGLPGGADVGQRRRRVAVRGARTGAVASTRRPQRHRSRQGPRPQAGTAGRAAGPEHAAPGRRRALRPGRLDGQARAVRTGLGEVPGAIRAPRRRSAGLAAGRQVDRGGRRRDRDRVVEVVEGQVAAVGAGLGQPGPGRACPWRRRTASPRRS